MTNAHNMHNFFHCLKAITMNPAQISVQWLVRQRIQFLYLRYRGERIK